MKKKYIITSALIVVLSIAYFSIISPIYENYEDATHVRNFTEDKENVFLNTSYGLFKIKKETNEISEIKKFNFTINEIVVDKNDEKWVISTLDGTLHSFKNENKVTKHDSPFKMDKNQLINDWVNIKIDKFGTKWILVSLSRSKYELYSYNLGHWEKYPFPEKVSLINGMFIDEYDNIIFPISNMQEKVNNNVNYITFSDKLLFLENYGTPGDLGEINSFRTRKWSQLDCPSEDFTLDKSFVDKENNIWITGGYKKNSLYRFQHPEFIKYNINKEIKALDSDSNGKVWIATEDGIEILNEKKSFIPKKKITEIFIDSNNKKWINKYFSNSIECYDGKEWKSYDFEIFRYVVKDFFDNLFK